MNDPTYKQVAELSQGLCLFVAKHPDMATEFMRVLTHRTQTQGFPEYALGEGAASAVIETLLQDEPSAHSIQAAKDVASPDPVLKPEQLPSSVYYYLHTIFGAVGVLALRRPQAIEYCFQNQSRAQLNLVTYLLAVHLDYVSSKDHIPY